MKRFRGLLALSLQPSVRSHHLLNKRPCTSPGFPGASAAYPSVENSNNCATQPWQGNRGYNHLSHKAVQAKPQVECAAQCSRCYLEYSRERGFLFMDVRFKTKRLPLKPLTARPYHSVTRSWKGPEKEHQLLLLTAQHAGVKAQVKTQCTGHGTGATDNTVGAENSDPNEDSDGETSDPSLEVMASSSATALKTVKVIPGKGPPPEPPVECCMSGCANCVWIVYAQELQNYYNDGGDAAREAIEQIENPSLRAFLKLELGL